MLDTSQAQVGLPRTAVPEPATSAPADTASQFESPAAQRVDPYWNFIPRSGLLYTLPALVFALDLQKGWIGGSRDFWVPLLFTFAALAPATRLRFGRVFAHKDYQHRDRFIASAGVLPASLWCAFVHVMPAWAAALATAAALIAWDALLLRFELLCVYAAGPGRHAGFAPGVLLRASLPFWTYFAAASLAVHQAGSDGLAPIAIATALMIAPVAAMWGLWRTRWAPARRLLGIRRVAVIGGGWSGIYAVRWLNEAGIDVTCFEARDTIGGIWKFHEDRPGGVMESTRVTSSKHFLHPSDFPFPESSLEFPYHPDVIAHLERYVDTFGIRDRFALEHEVTSVRQLDDGGWQVMVRAVDGGEREERFDAVVVSSGPHQHANIDPRRHPVYGSFTGRIMTAAQYKSARDINPDDRVLVVGVGESSADIVTECVHRGAAMHWSARSGQWFADRNMGPYPADHITTQGTRVFFGQFGFWEYLVRRFVTGAFVNLAWGRGGHGIPEWTPDTPYLHQFLNKSRDGLLEIYSGRVKPHRAPCRTNGRAVYFEQEDAPVMVDVIILATGYRPVWPFLEQQPDALHKVVFSRDNPTLAFVGFARPIVGSIPSLSELQARWVALAWSGRVTLPGARRVLTEVELDTKFHRRAIRDASRFGILKEQELYATDLASRFNANVHWLKLALTWPRAFLILWVSPWAPFKYLFNDPDPARRRAALQHTIRELPTPRAPSYLLALGVIAFEVLFLSVPAFVFYKLPVAPAIATLAVFGFLLTCGLRLSERERRMTVRPPGPVREVFPF